MAEQPLHARSTSSLGRASFGPTPVVSESGHAHSLEATHAWVRPLMRRVPITRVLDATPLDSIALPVWAAVTPLAKDLTVHAGKGATSLAARLSAIMEAIERTCAEALPPERLRAASYVELAREGPVLDPAKLSLPFDTAYAPDRVFRWTLGYDLVQDQPVWVPMDAVISPAEDGICRGVETNGLAAGNTLTEALLHALYELVERDAISLEQFCELHADVGELVSAPPRMVSVAELPENSRAWAERLHASGLQVLVQDLTNELEIPVFGAFIVDRDFAGNEGRVTMFAGHGCDLDTRRAVLRALTEATQAHSIVSMGARDTFEGTRPLPNRAPRLRRRLDVLHPRNLVPFRTPEEGSGDLWQDAQRVVARLAASGASRIIVVDLTRADLGVPVVRVIVPGLEHPYGSTTRRPGPRLLRRMV